jgi:hypothetical protein
MLHVRGIARIAPHPVATTAAPVVQSFPFRFNHSLWFASRPRLSCSLGERSTGLTTGRFNSSTWRRNASFSFCSLSISVIIDLLNKGPLLLFLIERQAWSVVIIASRKPRVCAYATARVSASPSSLSALYAASAAASSPTQGAPPSSRNNWLLFRSWRFSCALCRSLRYVQLGIKTYCGPGGR